MFGTLLEDEGDEVRKECTRLKRKLDFTKKCEIAYDASAGFVHGRFQAQNGADSMVHPCYTKSIGATVEGKSLVMLELSLRGCSWRLL